MTLNLKKALIPSAKYAGILFLALLVLITFIFFLFYFTTLNRITPELSDLSQAQVAIVLGAKIFPDGTLSSIFKDRVDKGITLYKDGYVETILVTGDNGSLDYNEVNPVRDYMLAQGVPSNVIFLDHAGFDTYSSMYRARQIFKIDSAIIVTQSFHLPRSIFLARWLGIDAVGTPSDQHAYLFKNNIREVLANVKAMMDLLTFRRPKYLGEAIPITGSSFGSI